MNDQEFLHQMKTKIQKLTGQEVDLQVDSTDTSRLTVELAEPLPKVTVGANLFRFPGFARMAIEYAVACIQQGRQVSTLEFQTLLTRN